MSRMLKILFGLVALLLLGGGWWLFERMNAEREDFEAFLLDLAAELPVREAEAYLEVVDLDRYGFRLSGRKTVRTFGEGQQAAFLTVARSWVQVVQGSGLDVRNLEANIEEDLGRATMSVLWQSANGSRRALVAVETTCFRRDGRWHVTFLKVDPARPSLKELL